MTEMKTTLDLLAPSLELAQLGHLPIGGGKWKGCGWIPWNIGEMVLVQMNQVAHTNDEEGDLPVGGRFSRLLDHREVKS